MRKLAPFLITFSLSAIIILVFYKLNTIKLESKSIEKVTKEKISKLPLFEFFTYLLTLGEAYCLMFLRILKYLIVIC